MTPNNEIESRYDYYKFKIMRKLGNSILNLVILDPLYDADPTYDVEGDVCFLTAKKDINICAESKIQLPLFEVNLFDDKELDEFEKLFFDLLFFANEKFGYKKKLDNDTFNLDYYSSIICNPVDNEFVKNKKTNSRTVNSKHVESGTIFLTKDQEHLGVLAEKNFATKYALMIVGEAITKVQL